MTGPRLGACPGPFHPSSRFTWPPQDCNVNSLQRPPPQGFSLRRRQNPVCKCMPRSTGCGGAQNASLLSVCPLEARRPPCSSGRGQSGRGSQRCGPRTRGGIRRLFRVRPAFRSWQSVLCPGHGGLQVRASPADRPSGELASTDHRILKRFPWHHQLVGPEFEQTPGR